MDFLSHSLDFSQLACATCMAGADDMNTRAATWSIVFLVAVIGPVLGAVMRFGFHLRRASRQQAPTL